MRRAWGLAGRIALAGAILALLAGCAGFAERTRAGFVPPEAPARILLMPVHVEMNALTSAGLLEPRADWTGQVEAHLESALRTEIGARGYGVAAPGAMPGDRQVQLVALHEAVAASVLAHGPDALVFALPTKRHGFDWTLGEGTRALVAAYGADLALFVMCEGSYATGGRIATSLAIGALFGVSPPLGDRLTLASMVDLRTGHIVWMGLEAGHDPREADGAARLVERLFDDAPF